LISLFQVQSKKKEKRREDGKNSEEQLPFDADFRSNVFDGENAKCSGRSANTANF
jgi:hypothetical protein